ncbi:hypothetical protein K503DRAFT_619657 [Rhizopogon vinicolor AM-OR11-026]|uniref:Uncharacterized protein n=1 Tax=Rhizopogon vinicolor AM-OR11-026 TaxID=1314800 RepID=A0A1B7N6B2_9AGAM|nr:hypothetical protein K503DRAFT_619657 [Rhizopogon vinicolor AM-OR11-026]
MHCPCKVSIMVRAPHHVRSKALQSRCCYNHTLCQRSPVCRPNVWGESYKRPGTTGTRIALVQRHHVPVSGNEFRPSRSGAIRLDKMWSWCHTSGTETDPRV